MSRVHYVYLLTRKLPEGAGLMYYVGIRTCPKRKTPETDTKYMGGGPWIRRAVKKHRAEFTKYIVEEFETREEAADLERAIVGLTTANSEWSYNLREGGGDAGLLSEETKAKLRASRRAQLADPAELEALRARSRTPQAREKARAATIKRYANETADQKAARSRAVSEGSRTPQAQENKRAATIKQYENPAAHEKTSAGNRNRYAGMTLDERRAQTAKAREASRTPQAREHSSAAALKRFENETADQKAARVAANRAATIKQLANETADQKAARGRAISEGIRRARAERSRETG